MMKQNLTLFIVLWALGCSTIIDPEDVDGAVEPDDAALDMVIRDGELQEVMVPRDMAMDALVPRDIAVDVSVPDVAVDVSVPDVAVDVSVPDVAVDVSMPDVAVDVSVPDVAVDVSVPDVAVDVPIDATLDVGQPVDLGMPPICAEPVLSNPICPALCGNGVLDQCLRGLNRRRPPPPFDAGPPPMAFEDCDGDALGTTCEGLGYVGGQLSCGATCHYDVSACDFCLADQRITACGSATEAGFRPNSFAMATGHDQVAVAWNAPSDQGDQIFLTLYDSATLAPTQTICVGPGQGWISLAATQAGYLLTVSNAQAQSIDIHPLDTGGAPLVAPIPVEGRSAELFPVANGGLMVFTEPGGGISTASIDPQGVVRWTTHLFDASLGRPAAIETADGYLIAQRSAAMQSDGTLFRGIITASLALNGGLRGLAFPVRPSTEYPSLSIDGDTIYLTYADFGNVPSLYMTTLRPDGSAIADVLLGAREMFNPAPVINDGQLAHILVGEYTGITDEADHLILHQRGPNQGQPMAINQSATRSKYWKMVRLDEDLLVGWIEVGGGIGLARITR